MHLCTGLFASTIPQKRESERKVYDVIFSVFLLLKANSLKWIGGIRFEGFDLGTHVRMHQVMLDVVGW